MHFNISFAQSVLLIEKSTISRVFILRERAKAGMNKIAFKSKFSLFSV